MPTSTIVFVAVAAVVSGVAAFIAGRWTSAASVAQKRYSKDAGKPPLWLKNYKSNEYTRTVYEKIVRLFEEEKPYLNPRLSEEDVSRHIGTNKGYVARAVKVYTGRNFCQFTNRYRVGYAEELSKSDPSLRVNELGFKSGFNSSTSFSVAFKMVKGVPPGEWLKQQKLRQMPL